MDEPRNIAPGLRKAAIITVAVVSILFVLLLKAEARHLHGNALSIMIAVGVIALAIIWALNLETARNAKIPHPGDLLEQRKREKRETDIT